MEKSYFNTTRLSGTDLKQAVQDSLLQEKAILLIYEHTQLAYSPSQIHKTMQRAGKKYPITSVRRAITVLQGKGKLFKTSNMITGDYGKPEHTWIIAPNKTNEYERSN